MKKEKTVNQKYRNYIKKLVDLPPNIGTPIYFHKLVGKLSKDSRVILKRLWVPVHPLIVAVDQSISKPSVVFIMGNPDSGVVDLALIGKGVTFDTGGYDIKTSHMVEMKSDKAGACTVLGTIKYILDNDIKINVVAIMPFVENKITETSTLPGSVVRSLSGRDVEITNTDAEGRLILADSLTTALTFNPRKIISIATLTGSCAAALGDDFIGAFSNINDTTFKGSIGQVFELSQTVGKDTMVNVSTLPGTTLLNKNRKKEPKAPLKNYVGKELGGSYAAAFLNEFVIKDGYHTPYLHLDIAGPAFIDGKATGAGIDILIDQVNQIVKFREF